MSRSNVRKLLIILCVTLGFMVLTACTAERAPSSETVQLNSNEVKEVKEVTPGHAQTQFTTTIYSLDLSSYAGKNINEIPYYSAGKIEYLSDKTVESFNEGHHPWLAHAESFISSKALNLVPDECKEQQGGIKSEFIKIKELSDGFAMAIITIRKNFFYEITLESSEETGGLFFITKIVLHMTIDKE
ncbi:hypothetical protein [Paenibacillus sp. GCM10027626]|uniref:hypothetical protein n=1 Tax=Paenibacillus sp. GCM10027626 TaxID=3273411 RepID=UPI00363B8F5D